VTGKTAAGWTIDSLPKEHSKTKKDLKQKRGGELDGRVANDWAIMQIKRSDQKKKKMERRGNDAGRLSSDESRLDSRSAKESR